MKLTQKEIAAAHNTTVPVIKKLAGQGIDIQDTEAVADAMRKTRHRIKPGTELSKTVADSLGEEMTIEQIRAAGMKATSIDDLKILDAKATLLQKIIKVKKEQGELVSLAGIDERDTRIGAAVGAAGSKLANELPPMLAGLSESEIQPIVHDKWHEIATMLSDAQSEFWDKSPAVRPN